ncbi:MULTISPECIES: transferase hexapeptide repeat family protein [unclassified Burkholderia]|uniref:acyltransferase n=1 Tax=unclassified Burkholderia TaxID=2613784 RepID=UPI000F5761FE|nr:MULTISPECIES: transferase hexapeptide repeat family protein [unclassified Burkholderia]RQR96365.1 transferase hexapeptide repeat family protein [Burkholderia sp. Bp8994]RQS25366.1 transferase hexapeptide repeat family protein [Burkholderia sp. Bp8995]RQS44971.1 transferase hexapeptide repeat family protein [Burkholderia sp. Bp8989]RQZ40482.1 transferase hexapeptide repeat family protein [Burkholderia sp. Bp9090]
MPLFEFDGMRPRVASSAYVHPSAVVIGDVTIGAGCYIGPHASLRGDFGAIVVGDGSNVQDGCVLHVGIRETCRLGVNSHIGHGAIVHGATLEPDTMIGMNAVVMDGATIGATTIVAACAFVKAGYDVPRGVLLAGMPGRVVRRLSDAEIDAKANGTRIYQQLAVDCLRGLRQIDDA